MKWRPILFQGAMVRALLDGSKTQTRRVAKVETTMGHDSISGPRRGKFARVYLLDKEHDLRDIANACPYGQPGDRLWVREAWSAGPTNPDCLEPGETYGALRYPLITYLADGETKQCYEPLRNISFGKGRPSIHMPRWASRITLEITAVRLERLQDISEADCIAEGCKADQPETWWQGYKDAGEPLGLMHTQTMGEEPPDWMIEPHKMNPTPWLVRVAKTYYQTLWQSINGHESWDANPLVWVVEFKVVQP